MLVGVLTTRGKREFPERRTVRTGVHRVVVVSEHPGELGRNVFAAVSTAGEFHGRFGLAPFDTVRLDRHGSTSTERPITMEDIRSTNTTTGWETDVLIGSPDRGPNSSDVAVDC